MKKIILLLLISISTTILYSKDLVVIENQTLPTCFNSNDGMITVIPDGGKKPYSIVWDNGTTDFKRANLRKGSYSYILTDARGEKIEKTIKLNGPLPLSVSFNSEEPFLLENGQGILNISVDGGNTLEGNNSKYLIKLNEQTNLSSIVNTLNSEKNILEVADSKGCSFQFPVSIILSHHTNHQEVQVKEHFNTKYPVIYLNVKPEKKSDENLSAEIK